MSLKASILFSQLLLIKLIAVNAYDVNGEENDVWDNQDRLPCGSLTCNGSTQDCINNMTCACKPDFEFKEDRQCHLCPTEGHLCTGCCYGEAVCYAGRCQRCWKDQNGECIPQDSLFFLTAAQVALATAMVIGVSALATLMYKTFRARSRNNGQRILESELRRSSSSRLSLSSIQIRILRRLRDRPPKYETRHNYEFHQRERTQSETTRQPTNTPAELPQQQSRTPIVGAPPPAYDGDVASLVDFPPPYSAEPPHPNARIAIVSEQGRRPATVEGATDGVSDRDQVNTSETREPGVVNRAFEDTEDGNAKTETSADINLANGTEHKTIHI